jgi:hypothetical protein
LKKQNFLKLVYCSLVILVLAGYNQCIAPGGNATKSAIKFGVRKPSSTGGFATEEERQISIQAFRETVHPITRANCVGCHGVSQSPLHAVEDAEVAHDALINNAKVDFNNIPNSRLVQKLKNEFHNCWDDCDISSSEMQAAITEWKRIIDDSAANKTTPPVVTPPVVVPPVVTPPVVTPPKVTPPVTPPVVTPPVTPPVVTPPVTPPVVTPPVTPPVVTPPVVLLSSAEGFKQTVWPFLRSNCMGCHGTSQTPLHSHADYNVAHTNVINYALVNFTTVTSSKFLAKLRAKHNCGSNCAAWGVEVEKQINSWKTLSGK